MNLSTQIDELQLKEITREFFEENYIKKNKPAIIKGVVENSPASKTWTVENLKKRIGHYPIKVFNINEKNGTSYLFAKHEIKLEEMFKLIETNTASDYRMFVNPILKKDKELRDELPCPDFFKCRFQLPSLLFLAGKGCIVPLHYDFIKDNGLLTQFFGRKEVILVDHSQSALLYRLPLNSTSMVNLFEPDYSKYPALKKLKGIKATLEHGDTLFIPSGYWHNIKYVDASMSVAFRIWNTNPLTTITEVGKQVTQIPIDKTINYLSSGKSWLNYKQKIAKQRAEQL